MLSVNIYFLIMSTTLTICALDSKNDLDPFDMVNFDQVLMRMKNKKACIIMNVTFSDFVSSY